MLNVGMSILHQLTTALFRNDIFQVGYLLMAYSGIPGKAGELKNKFVSWLAIETLASVPHDTQYCDSDCVYCIDNSGAVVLFMKSYLNPALAPIQYLGRINSMGEYIAKHFASIGDGKGVCSAKQEVIKNIKALLIKTKRVGLAEDLGLLRVLYMPVCGTRTAACVFCSDEGQGSEQTIAIPMKTSLDINENELVCWVLSLVLAQGINPEREKESMQTGNVPVTVFFSSGQSNKGKTLEINRRAGIIYQELYAGPQQNLYK